MKSKIGRKNCKFIVVGDLHLHDKPYLNSLERAKTLLRDIEVISKSNGNCPIILNGDIFHVHRPSFSVMMVFWEFLSRAPKVVINTGNHDYFSLTDPSESYLDLFDAFPNVTVVNSQVFYEAYEDKNFGVLVAPWRPSEIFLKIAKEASKKLYPIPNILIAHQPITEGVINSEGIKVNQDLSVKDLSKLGFKYTFLSDYHEYQQLSPSVWCIGAPISTKHGEEEQHGVVGVFYEEGEGLSWEHIPLPSTYSQFKTWRVEEDLYLPGYDDNDYNRIYVPANKKAEVALLYPNAQVIGEFEAKRIHTSLNPEDLEGDSTDIFKKFVKSRTYKNKREKLVMRKMLVHFYKEAREKLSKEGK